jgi:hypothetical protein
VIASGNAVKVKNGDRAFKGFLLEGPNAIKSTATRNEVKLSHTIPAEKSFRGFLSHKRKPTMITSRNAVKLTLPPGIYLLQGSDRNKTQCDSYKECSTAQKKRTMIGLLVGSYLLPQ